MNICAIGQHHSEMPQNNVWIDSPGGDLILIWSRDATVQQNSRERRMNLMLTESFLVMSSTCLWLLLPLSP